MYFSNYLALRLITHEECIKYYPFHPLQHERPLTEMIFYFCYNVDVIIIVRKAVPAAPFKAPIF